MKNIPLFLLLSVMLASCSPKVAPLVDEDGTDWNARAAEYRENPTALRDMVRDYETNKAEVNRLRQQVSATDVDRSDMQDQLATAQASADQAYQQIQSLTQQLTAAENTNRPDEMITDQPAMQVKGVIFQVQLGAYAEDRNKVSGDMATGDALDLTDQNGMQKVVVSRFRTYKNAANLRDRLKKMGVKDAFVVAMNDGQRVEVQEALRMSGQN